MLDAHRLMIFRSVAATGSVAAAAASLGYTPSAVSQHVAALQRETGLKLLERVGRGVELTPAGRVLATEADGVLSSLNDLGATVDDLRAGKANRITMNVFATAGTHWMPSVVQTLSAEFPDTRLRLRIEDEVTEIAARRPDLAVAVRQEHGQTTAVQGFSHEDLVVESYVAVVPADHAFAGRELVDMAELEHERWIDNDVRRGACRQAVLDACAAAGFTPRFVVETTDYPSALRFVARGVGVTVLPRLGATELPPGTVAVDVCNPAPRRTIVAYVKDSECRNPVVRRAMHLLREAAATASRP
ncbi:LysR family transcriptional regulator [Tsukamurella tyrosinosolvens]|uniref:LysR substrate-binding domain-containing protein n=1 Tax=Tsukamurella tyrosinosolvens TaxID=57704 RepID=UPI000795407F|nr:LysR substrate-binding domain-containing protein [Tsukamurella tyrosinosolvens]AUN38887.1 LysR family transcriptional regulator [Tsukamurella tyrosinosolvens]KXP02134.1 LysR family transcriptional regulator [Tsukamurella tyrosinosolvens]KZL96284.1 LysR family transcriptional regulator [Tsukamurella tyrosinosolvens]MCA4996132.1 LysR family transcriptional regulator [Tsukamurella tyrosinosolvens]MEC4614873.1 LysR substrate-binding domain-containing protein [Tsukamurella tyrosinosolvens]